MSILMSCLEEAEINLNPKMKIQNLNKLKNSAKELDMKEQTKSFLQKKIESIINNTENLEYFS